MAGVVRAANACQVFKFLDESRCQPIVNEESRKQFQLRAIFQRSICRQDQVKGEIMENESIVKVVEPRGSKLGEKVPGIEKKVYQLRVK